jgi:hypothetical protein
MQSQNYKISESVLKIIKIAFLVKLILLLIRCFAPFNHPHIGRQFITMGVSLRYWLRWFFEENVVYPLLPVELIVSSANQYSITELPFINILTAPFFYFGYYYGRVLSYAFLILFNFLLTFLSYKIWKGKEIFKIDVGISILILAILSLSGQYIGRFMPDYTAFIFVILALGMMWKGGKIGGEKIKSGKRFFAMFTAFICASLGLLIKPPVVITLIFVFFKKNRREILRDFIWIVPAILITILYYTWGHSEILKMPLVLKHFNTGFRNPLDALSSFLFVNPKAIFDFFEENIFLPYLIYFVLGYQMYRAIKFKEYAFSKLWLVLLIQIFAIVLLDGYHSLVHTYYYVGISLTSTLILTEILSKTKSKIVVGIIFIWIVVFNLERFFYQIKPLIRENKKLSCRHQRMYPQCQKLIEDNQDFPWGKGVSFRSNSDPVPYLGICFGEIKGHNHSKYGFYWKNDSVPQNCQIVDSSDDINLVTCM